MSPSTRLRSPWHRSLEQAGGRYGPNGSEGPGRGETLDEIGADVAAACENRLWIEGFTMRESHTPQDSADDHQSLDAIGILEGNLDKTSMYRDYLRHYERHFAAIRNDPIQLLEIGVAGGTSLRTWARYFPKASITGVDSDENCRKLTGDRIRIEIGSQTDYEFLAGLVTKNAFSVIIDDGSHRAPDMILTFDRLFPFLIPGGLYVIEDVYLHYGDHATTWHTDGGCTAADHFTAIARRIVADHVEPGSDAATRYFSESIDSIEFIPGAIIVRKKRRSDRAEMLARLWNLADSADIASTWFGLALVFINNGDLERAEMAARRAVVLTTANGIYLSRLAWIQAHRGKFMDAIETMKVAVQFAPDGSNFAPQLADYEARARDAT